MTTDANADSRRVRRHATALIVLVVIALGLFFSIRSLGPDTEAMKQACLEQGGFGENLISISEPDRMSNPPVDVMEKWGASNLYFIDIVYDSANGQQSVKCLAIPRQDHIQATIL